MKKLNIFLFILLFIFGCSFNKMTEVQKYNEYVKFDNYINGNLYLILKDYFGVFSYSETLSGKPDNYKMIPINEDFEDKIEETKKIIHYKKDMGILDDSAESLIIEIEVILKDLKLMEDYYNTKKFLDDDMLEGKKLHKTIYDDYQKFNSKATEFKEYLLEKEESINKKELEFYKNKKQYISYYSLKSLKNLEKILNSFKLDGINSDNLLISDSNKIIGLIDIYNDELEKLIDYSKEPKLYKKEKINEDKKEDFAKYIICLEEAKEELNILKERLVTRVPVGRDSLSNDSLRTETAGTPESIEDKYNKAVLEYNKFKR